MAGIGNKTCPHCGRVIGKDDEYCLHCGIKLIEGEDSLSKPLMEQGKLKVPLFLKARIGFLSTKKIIFALGAVVFALLATLFFGIGAVQADMTGKIVMMVIGGLMVLLYFVAAFVLSLIRGNKAVPDEVKVYENHIDFQQKQTHASPSFVNLLYAYQLKEGLLLHFVEENGDPFLFLSFACMDGATKETLIAKGQEVGMKGEKK